MEDYQAVLEGCTSLHHDVGASIINHRRAVKYDEQSSTDTLIRGLTPSMAPILDLDLDAGRVLNETRCGKPLAGRVIGTDIVDNLLAGVDPLGKEIRVDGQCTG